MSQINVGEELRKAAVEPLLPIEKKLIGWSLGIGVVSLVILAVVNHLSPASILRSSQTAMRPTCSSTFNWGSRRSFHTSSMWL